MFKVLLLSLLLMFLYLIFLILPTSLMFFCFQNFSCFFKVISVLMCSVIVLWLHLEWIMSFCILFRKFYIYLCDSVPNCWGSFNVSSDLLRKSFITTTASVRVQDCMSADIYLSSHLSIYLSIYLLYFNWFYENTLLHHVRNRSWTEK